MTTQFSATSSEPYIRHTYKVVLNDGQKVMVEDYEHLYGLWRMIPDNLKGYVQVVDVEPLKPEKKNKHRKKSGGFG